MADQSTMSHAMPPLGADRLWVTHGLVAPETDNQKSVLFDDADGNPLPYPLVMVVLQPSGTTVPCRVASPVAGDGEGTWVPFVAGDEVLVVVPEGHERAGCCVVGRLNQSLDKWPRQVAGQDSTKNTFSFRRTIPPHVEETVGGYLIRSAKTGAFLGIDPAGQVTLANGDAAQLHIGADFLGLSTADNSCTVQLNPGDQSAFIQGNGTQMLLNHDGLTLLTPGVVQFGTAGFQPTGHAVAAEQVVVLVEAVFLAFAAVLAPVGAPLTGTSLAALFSTPTLMAPIMAAAVAAAAGLPIDPTITAALQASLSAPPDHSGAKPGYGKAGFLF